MDVEIRSHAASLVGYLRYNALRIGLDLLAVASWMVVASALLQSLNVVRWAQYVALFAGVIAYAMVTPAWEPRRTTRSRRSDEPQHGETERE
ncbi:hypothetical protein BRC81_15345 [Halobacteriales archaeon QS_1_68_20]|nr:MAG: hypothetical protein BRC81_15345 [Halobacteriales archaeon QS_1_68_20]